jgi:hypothetical protein
MESQTDGSHKNSGEVMADLSPAYEMQKVAQLAQELFENVLYDEEPLFVSDEATLWAVSMSDVNDVLERIRKYYGVPVTLEDTKQPLWKLLRMLNAKRRVDVAFRGESGT